MSEPEFIPFSPEKEEKRSAVVVVPRRFVCGRRGGFHLRLTYSTAPPPKSPRGKEGGEKVIGKMC